MGFAFVAGAGTALSPCVLPILPAVLGAGVTGGRLRPAGVVAGLALSFTFATVALVYVIDLLGLPNDLVRMLAIVVLLAFGVGLIIPGALDRAEAWFSRFAAAPRHRGEGLGSGLLLGASLGLLYAPCAGPILAGVITVSAAQEFTIGKLAVALAYGAGTAAVLYALLIGGRRLASTLSGYRAQVQVAMGALMVCAAVVMYMELDLRFQSAIADDLPSALVNPTGELESLDVVSSRLAEVRGGEVHAEAGESELEAGHPLPSLGPAPELVATQRWFNTEDGRSLTLEELRGRVVLLDFWTYTCINCIRTLAYLRAWDEEYRERGLTVLGVHTPEFPFEKEADNVAMAIEEFDIRYPVVQDNDYGTWTAYGNHFWPAKYLVDAAGDLRYVHFGEGEYETTELAIRSLLAEAGRDDLGQGAEARAESADPRVTTPETYLGATRAEGFVNGPLQRGAQRFGGGEGPLALPPDHLAYRGRWRIARESATALHRAALDLNFGARRVFLVLGSPGRARDVRVLLDGRPIPDRLAGEDVRDGEVAVSRHRLYRLVELAEAGRHTLTLEPERGVSGYAFTFG